jgi:nucleobase:cation symporter-1, NCS1 family
MSKANRDALSDVESEALDGRLPVLASERVYKTYSSFLWTCCTASAATWAFLIGGYLPYVGDWRIGVLGYVVGLIIGMGIVTLASGAPSFKYGTDVIDTAKSAFGSRGIVIPLIGLLATLIGWSFVLEALTARGAANIAATMTGSQVTGSSHEHLVVAVAFIALVLVWFITAKGPKLFERLNAYIGPLHMIITLIMYGILIHKFGLEHLWTTQLPTDQMLAKTSSQGFALALEFGVSNSMTWWPIMGGLTRLVSKRKNIIGPSIMGVGILGAAFISSLAALAAISAGTYDPTVWMITVGGPYFGSLVMCIVLTANIGTMVLNVYLAGVSIQQVKVLAKMNWKLLLALMLAPGIYFAFKTEWLLSAVMNWLSYNGVMFVGITGVTFIDYFFLRKQSLDPAHLFAKEKGKYTFWNGINWAAIVVTAAVTAGYLWLYNPVTSAMADPFRWAGASIPMMIAAAISYYLITRLVVIPLGKGSYNDAQGNSTAATASPDGKTDQLKVSL